jgi:hypothetical protein
MRTDVPAHDPRTATREICGAVRARLNYRLRCHLPVHHGGEHRWTPEILPTDEGTGTQHRSRPVITRRRAPPGVLRGD